jgi:hypothetical protein
MPLGDRLGQRSIRIVSYLTAAQPNLLRPNASNGSSRGSPVSARHGNGGIPNVL